MNQIVEHDFGTIVRELSRIYAKDKNLFFHIRHANYITKEKLGISDWDINIAYKFFKTLTLNKRSKVLCLLLYN